MGGTSTQQAQTQQSSQTNPWEPTQGLLTNILGGLNGQFGNTTPSAAETGALNTIQGNAQSQPSFGPQATQYANNLLSGGGTAANSGILGDAYKTLQGQLSPVANQNNDPMQTPGIQALLDQIRGDVSNQVNGQFAGAGRDLSGLNQQTLARGIAQGEAQPLLNQYNQNVAAQQGAANNLFNAGGNTASGLQNFAQQGYANQAQGLDAGINGIPAAQNAGANSILAAAQQQRNRPLSNLQNILGLTLPIAGLGGQSTGQSNSTGSQTMSGAQQFATIAQGIGSLFGGSSGAAGATGSGAPAAFKFFASDRRAKDDIQKIGELFDGTPVYRFRYKGDPRVSVGLMADDVEQFAPSAVVEVGGLKMVDYGAATERAALMGGK